MVVGVAQLITRSSDSNKDLVSNGGANFGTDGGCGSGDVGFNVVEGINQCDKARGRGKRESDTISGH